MKMQAHPDANLSQTQLEELAEQLSSNRHELISALEILNQQIAAKDDCSVSDAAEAAGLQESRARATGIAVQHKQTIAEIDLALGRLEAGRYGISETSGEAIAFERLSLIPWARTGADD